MAKPSTSKKYRIVVPKGLDFETDQFLELYRYLTMNRRLDERLGHLYRQNHIVGGLYSSLGQEATSVGTAYALQDGDLLAPMIRNLGSYLVRGVSAKDWFAQYTARACGPTKGKDASAHFGALDKGLIGCISMLGALIPVMAGCAMTLKHKGQKNVAMTYIGDGGTSTTDFHEGVNFAAVQKVPLILVMENNLWAYSTYVSKQFPTKDLVSKAPAYGCYGEAFDGNNVLAAYDAAKRARERCIEDNGPVLLEAITFRRKGHAEHDPAGYVPKEMREEWEKKDPIDAYTRFLLDEQIADQSTLDAMDEEIVNELETAAEEILASPFPDPSAAAEGVYASDNKDGGPQ